MSRGALVSVRKRVFLKLSRILLCTLIGAMAAARALAVTTYYVDGASTSCSNTGPGSSSIPYCTISQAVTDRAGPGVIINVKPATYREQVTVSASGASGNPFVLQASGSTPIIVDGADDFS